MDAAEFEVACDRLQEALAIAREIGDAFLECAALSNIVLLLKEMGLYTDAIAVGVRALALAPDSERGRHLRFLIAGNGLFCASRIRDESACLRYVQEGSRLVRNPEIDPVSRATFELYRAIYLVASDDHETADALIQAAQVDLANLQNPRVEIQIGIAVALCDWASGDLERQPRARKRLRELYHRSKLSGLYFDDVLRASVEIHGRSPVREECELGIAHAHELVTYIASVKRVAFFRQLNGRGVELQVAPPAQDPADPLAAARQWLEESRPRAATPPSVVVHKHDELNAIHDELAQLRTESLRRSIRTAAYDVAEDWALVAEFLDDQTGQHCFRVGRLAGMLAEEIGMDEEFCVRIEHAARLHDIGKIGVNAMVLLKPGPLDPLELTAMRLHTEVGAQLLGGAKDPTLQMAALIAKHHHEWWNGSGYPSGLRLASIPLAARICSFADVYDALTHARPYKAPWSHRTAVEHMLSEKATHFDPDLTTPFLRVLERYLAPTATPLSQRHLKDMEANALLRSRRNLMAAVTRSPSR
jgi:putative nucleotidyltransferase with HDIG domain